MRNNIYICRKRGKRVVSQRDLLSLISPVPHEAIVLEAKEKKKKLTFSVAHLLERRFVTERVFARLYDEGKTRSDRLDRLCRLLLLSGGHRVAFFFGGLKGGSWRGCQM